MRTTTTLFMVLHALFPLVHGATVVRGGEKAAYRLEAHNDDVHVISTQHSSAANNANADGASDNNNQTNTSSSHSFHDGTRQAGSLRQDFCSRVQRISNGEIELKDALSGMSLTTIVGATTGFFHYNEETGIDPENPGITASIMDSLAERGNFSWRNSFAAPMIPSSYNKTYTQFLLWSIDHFDLAVDWYDNTVERMEKGAAFIEPWYDGRLILIDHMAPPEKGKINFFNWAKPFDTEVWALIIFTVVLSAVVYQLIEYMNGEKEDRSFFQWMSDNLYLSSLNFTQNFEYAPNSVAGRIFGVSASIWALVITATYTANLASLLVEKQKPAMIVDSIEHAILLGIPICAIGNSNHEAFLRRKYRNADLVLHTNQLQSYEALRRGECGLIADAKDSWLTFEKDRKYNPDCDLEWVGRTVTNIRSGFAVKADSGELCSSLVRDVLTLHMLAFINDGGLDAAWTKHRSNSQDQHCSAPEALTSDLGLGRRQLTTTYYQNTHLSKFLHGPDLPSSPSSHHPSSNTRHRFLKGAGQGLTATASSATSDTTNTALSVEQMIGTFLLHWVSMAVAILVSLVANQYCKWEDKILAAQGFVREQVSFRRHGPIIGMPPRMNTAVIRKSTPHLDVSDWSAASVNDHAALGSKNFSVQRNSTSVVRNSTYGYASKQLLTTKQQQALDRLQEFESAKREIQDALAESSSSEFERQRKRLTVATEDLSESWQQSVQLMGNRIDDVVERMEIMDSNMDKKLEKMDEKLEKLFLLLQSRGGEG